MKTIKWYRKNGTIIGCEVDGIEINMLGVVQNEILHSLYHEELKKEVVHEGNTGNGDSVSSVLDSYRSDSSGYNQLCGEENEEQER